MKKLKPTSNFRTSKSFPFVARTDNQLLSSLTPHCPTAVSSLATLCKSSTVRNLAISASNRAISASISSWRCCARMMGSKRKGHRVWAK